MLEPRVWFNRTFSSVYNVIRLLRDPQAPVRAHVFCTHLNPDFVGFEVSDSAALEPAALSESDYVDWCLETCKRRDVEVLVPGRAAIAIAARREEFERLGIRLLLAASADAMELFEDKPRFGRELSPVVAVVPRFEVVNTAAEFTAACARLQADGLPVCFKPGRSVGALGFRILDDERTDLQNLLGGEQIRITTAMATSILAAQPEFRDLLVMEYLDGAEYSIDCLARRGRLLRAVARRKPVRLGGSQLIEDRPDLLSLAERMTASYELDSLFNIQVRDGAGVPKVLEINARMSGGIYFACLSGVNFPAWAVALALDAAREEDVPEPRLGLRVGQQFNEFTMRHAFAEDAV